MLDQLDRINVLFDIYAMLLTEKQQQVLQKYFSDNCSLGEIAVEYGISRQAVHDLIHRALGSIEKFENKLGLYKLFTEQQELLAEAESLLLNDQIGKNDINRIKEIIARLRFSSEQ